MKYKIKSNNDKTSLDHLKMGKFDWVLWYGSFRDDCYQVQGLFRNVPADRAHANMIDLDDNYLRAEQLTFQSRKAAYRYIVKHMQWLVDDYNKRNSTRCQMIMATQWRGSGKFYVPVNRKYIK